MVLLEHQHRSSGDRDEIDEGLILVRRATAVDSGPYALQAAIAAQHARAASAADTDWPELVRLYGELAREHPSPVVQLNRAVAVAMAEGPEAGLGLIDAISGLDGYHLLHAARADLLRRLDRGPEAAESYRRAVELTTNRAEQEFLERRLRQLA
jgi:RNA polymerase sigma-70 factor (ECF subfamily)